MEQDPMTMVSDISDLVDQAVNTITGKVDGVRNAGQTPCYKLGIYEEALGTRRNQYRGMVGRVAAFQDAGERAVEAAINNQGRPSSRHVGGTRFAAYLANTVLPTPPGVVLGAFLGLNIGAAAAQGAWIHWLNQRLGTGRPSGSRRGTKLFGTMNDVRLRNGRIQGPAIRAAWDQWAVQQAAVVDPPGKPNWRTQVERANAKLVPLGELLTELEENVEQWEVLCLAQNAIEQDRIDQGLTAEIDSQSEQDLTERIKALAPIAIGGLILFGLLKRAK
jgi:hypothetical protein|tara:strand:- start:1814 stop:2641 length:828 start_codon:yes stop_codon:yes gene_type:complete